MRKIKGPTARVPSAPSIRVSFPAAVYIGRMPRGVLARPVLQKLLNDLREVTGRYRVFDQKIKDPLGNIKVAAKRFDNAYPVFTQDHHRKRTPRCQQAIGKRFPAQLRRSLR